MGLLANAAIAHDGWEVVIPVVQIEEDEPTAKPSVGNPEAPVVVVTEQTDQQHLATESLPPVFRIPPKSQTSVNSARTKPTIPPRFHLAPRNGSPKAAPRITPELRPASSTQPHPAKKIPSPSSPNHVAASDEQVPTVVVDLKPDDAELTPDEKLSPAPDPSGFAEQILRAEPVSTLDAAVPEETRPQSEQLSENVVIDLSIDIPEPQSIAVLERTGVFQPSRTGRLIRTTKPQLPCRDEFNETWIVGTLPDQDVEFKPAAISESELQPRSAAVQVIRFAEAASINPLHARAPSLLADDTPTTATPSPSAASMIPVALAQVPTPAAPVKPKAPAVSATPLVPAQSPANGEAPDQTQPSSQETEPEDFKPISQLVVSIAPREGAMPENRAAAKFAKAGEEMHSMGFSRPHPETQFEWDAPALCHRPLLFEDPNLERHGYHRKYLQPWLSAAHFFGHVPTVPYMVVSERARECTYTLGHYRPGSYAPYHWYYPRVSLDAGAVETAVALGIFFVLP